LGFWLGSFLKRNPIILFFSNYSSANLHAFPLLALHLPLMQAAEQRLLAHVKAALPGAVWPAIILMAPGSSQNARPQISKDNT
jgi:hypothetical protein